MKEMLGNLADGQIEFYKAVCKSIYRSIGILKRSVGYGGMGENYTYYPTDTC